MAKLKVHGGDFAAHGSSAIFFGSFSLYQSKGAFKSETIPFTELESVEIATEESVKRIGGTLGWGAVGAVALGPVGALAGLLLGGKGKEVTFIAKFKDGRKLLATTDSKTFTKIQAAAL